MKIIMNCHELTNVLIDTEVISKGWYVERIVSTSTNRINIFIKKKFKDKEEE